MAKKSDIGYVYIFTNESFREGWVKIGKTQNIDQRLTQLDNTSCPLPFDVYATLKTNRYHEAEDFVHDYISHFNQSLRIRPNREYFKVSPEEALDILYKVKRIMNEPDAEITVYNEQGEKYAKQFEKKHSRHENVEDLPVLPQNEEYKPDSNASQTVWLLSSNKRYFDLKSCYQKEGHVYWQVKSNFKTVKEGDRGYIYSSAPDKAIIYSFDVVSGPIPYDPVMDKEDKYSKVGKNIEWGNIGGLFAHLKLTKLKSSKMLSLEQLTKNGLNGAPQNAIILSQEKYYSVLRYIEGNCRIADTGVSAVNKEGISPRLCSLKTLPAYFNYLSSNLTKEVMESIGMHSEISEITNISDLEKLKQEIKKVEKKHRYHNTHSCALSQYINYIKAGLTFDDMKHDVLLVKSNNKKSNNKW